VAYGYDWKENLAILKKRMSAKLSMRLSMKKQQVQNSKENVLLW